MVKEKDEEVKEVKVKKVPYTLHAWYAYQDQEGFKVKAEYKSEGDTVKELLANIDPAFPSGCNRLVNVTVKHGDFEYARGFAPHVARAILEHKDTVTFEKLFRE